MLSLRRLARFLLPAVLALAPALVRAQVCEGSVWLDTQAEVDAFACTEVTGDLHIGGTLFYPYDQSDIYNLDALSSLTAVGGKLEIVGR